MICSNQDNNSKKYKATRYDLPKGIIENYNVIIKKSHEQPIISNVKRYEEIIKLKTGQSEDYTTECLLYYNYISNHCRLIGVDLSRQKELDADTKAIHQIEFGGWLKNIDGENADDTQSMFVLTILQKMKEARLKFSPGSLKVF